MKVRAGGLAAIVGSMAFCLALPAFGQVVQLQLTGVQGAQYNGSGVYAGFYYGTVNGVATTIVCDDYNTEIGIGLIWNATVLTAPQIPAAITSTKFGSSLGANAITDYAEIATLVEVMFNPAETPAQQADLSGAIWDIADDGTAPVLDAGASADLAFAQSFVTLNGAANVLAADANLVLYTPVPLNASQEMWSETSPDPNPNGPPIVPLIPAPEGGAASLYLLLAGAACFGAMVFSSRNKFGSRETA